jgi:hypothetical protein
MKQNKNFAMFVFLVPHKNDLVESCSSFEDLSANKISWSHTKWCKFCISLRSLKQNDNKLCHQGYLQWYDHPAEFNKNLLNGLKVDGEGGAHRKVIS